MNFLYSTADKCSEMSAGKLTQLVACVAGILMVLAAPASARNNWQGQATITAINQTCIDNEETIGKMFKSIFRPSSVSDNGNVTYLLFYGDRNLTALKMTGRPVAGKNYASTYVGTYGDFGPALAGQIDSFSMTPSTITPTTQFINLTIVISNWSTLQGCTVTMDGAYVLRR